MTLSMPKADGFMNCWRILEAFLHSPVDCQRTVRDTRSYSLLLESELGKGLLIPMLGILTVFLRACGA